MVLESGEEPKIDATVCRRKVSIGGEKFTNGSGAINPHGFAIEQTETLAARSRGIGKAVPENLHARANR
jgi:hypothetical protein